MSSATSDNGSGAFPPPSSSATVPPSEVDLVTKLDRMLAEVKNNLELVAAMRKQIDLIEAVIKIGRDRRGV